MMTGLPVAETRSLRRRASWESRGYPRCGSSSIDLDWSRFGRPHWVVDRKGSKRMSVRFNAVFCRVKGRSTVAGAAFDLSIPELGCTRSLVGERELSRAAADMVADSVAEESSEALIVVASPPIRRSHALHVDVHSPRDLGIQHNYFVADDLQREERATRYEDFLTGVPEGAAVKMIPARWDWRPCPGTMVRLAGEAGFDVWPVRSRPAMRGGDQG